LWQKLYLKHFKHIRQVDVLDKNGNQLSSFTWRNYFNLKSKTTPKSVNKLLVHGQNDRYFIIDPSNELID